MYVIYWGSPYFNYKSKSGSWGNLNIAWLYKSKDEAEKVAKAYDFATTVSVAFIHPLNIEE